MPWIRYILTVPIVAGLLTLGVAEAAWLAWRYDPLEPAGVLVAPDQIIPAGRPAEAWAFLHTRRALADERLVATAELPGRPGQPWLAHPGYPGTFEVRFDFPAAAAHGKDFAPVPFRLDPECGFGPLEATAGVFRFDRTCRFVAIDLEAVRSFGRYEWGPHRQQVTDVLAGRQPVYLADVRDERYNQIRAELESSGWPAGPLLAWQASPRGPAQGKDATVRFLLARLGDNLDLAVVADIEDNRAAFRQPGQRPVSVVNGPTVFSPG